MMHRPTILFLTTIALNYEPQTVRSLWLLRESFGTRYSKRSAVSQQKRRKAARRAHPHGF